MHRVDEASEGNLTEEAVDSEEEEALTGEYAMASYSNTGCSARHAGHIRRRQHIAAAAEAGCFNVISGGASKHDQQDGSFKLDCVKNKGEVVNQRLYSQRDCQGAMTQMRKVQWAMFLGQCTNQQRLQPALQKSHYPQCKVPEAERVPIADVHILGSMADSISADDTEAAVPPPPEPAEKPAAPPKPAEKPVTPPAPAEAAAKPAVETATKPADKNGTLQSLHQDRNETLQSLRQDQKMQQASNPTIGWVEAAAWHSMFSDNASALGDDNASVLADLLKLPVRDPRQQRAANLVVTAANRTVQKANGTSRQPAMPLPMVPRQNLTFQQPAMQRPMAPMAPQPQALGQIRPNSTVQGAPQPQALGAIRQNATSGLQQDMGVVMEADKIAKEGMRKYKRKSALEQAPQHEAKQGSTRNRALVQKERKQSGREAVSTESFLIEGTKKDQAFRDADAAAKAEQSKKEEDDIENALTDSIDALGAGEEDLAESSDLAMVKFRDGAKTFEIEFVRNTSIRDVKVLAEAQSSVKADKMQLTTNGRVLQDTDWLDKSAQEVDITASP